MITSDFTRKLLQWNKKSNTRSMPWKGERDPYKIWLSEIILQQTRVEQGWAYYELFIKRFPRISDLAAASDGEVFKMWEGLGYYNRCKNLLETARTIIRDFKGQFPSDYIGILALKGVGPYTGAAIASFAFNLPHAVVDGNVERVLSRYFGIKTPVDSSEGKKFYQELAQALLDKKNPGLYNQAIMDFGAVICKPQNPLCGQCIQQKDCLAYKMEAQADLPVKKKRLEKKTRYFYYFLLYYRGQVYVRQRLEKDIWQHLYEFVLLEKSIPQTPEKIMKSPWAQTVFGKKMPSVKSVSPQFRQQLSHQTIFGQFFQVELKAPLQVTQNYQRVRLKELKDLAFPRMIRSYLADLPI